MDYPNQSTFLILGSPFRLSVPSRQGEVLSVSKDGNIFYSKPSCNEIDDSWTFEPPNTGFYTEGVYLVSSRYKLAINYRPECGECLSTSPLAFQSQHTIWYITPNSEIYTIDSEGEKRYLWSILNSVYVTPDEHLAEKWTAVSMEGYDIGSQPQEKFTINPLIVCGVVLLFLIFLVFILKKSY